MNPSKPDERAIALEAEFHARQRASYAFMGNRRERRAEEAIARREAAKAPPRPNAGPVFYGRATSADVIAG